MADSGQDKHADSSFDDDLDKMLQDTADQMDDEQDIFDSDEAINRLLGDSQDAEVLDEDSSESVDDLVDSLLDGVVAKPERKVDALLQETQQPDVFEEIDEFGDDPVELEKPSSPEPESVLTDDDMSAFADELLAEQEGIDAAMQQKAQSVADSVESMAEIDDFLLADFDLSADDDDFKVEVLSPAAESVRSIPAAESEIIRESVTPVMTADLKNSAVAHDEQSARMAQIESELTALKLGLNASEALDQAVKEQKRANRELDEANKKLRIWSVSALVIGILALVVGVAVIILNLGLSSNVEQMQGSVMDIEDRLAASAIALVEPNGASMEGLQLSVQSMQALVNDMPERLNALQGQVNAINTEEIQQVVDKQFVNINEKLAAIEAKIASLKSAKATPKAASRKLVKRVAVPEWVVNLVSFKQRWYTDKKVQEYKQKGIPAEVAPVDVNGVEWFVIRVVGFKNKTQATVYAAKMKKALNLSSVWVSGK
ncbi:MAG: SPOR domain-containing protein [Methylococcaceae bacterium]|nr:SPOR domain-containing protein [Methylococcaceae bacterium]